LSVKLAYCIPVAPERIWNLGARFRSESGGTRRKKFCWSCPSSFLALKVQISRFGERFCEFLVCCSSTPRVQPFVKVGCPRAPWSQRYCCLPPHLQ